MTDRREITDAEEARIQRMIASDPDAPEATDEQLAQAVPFTEAWAAMMAQMRRKERAAALTAIVAHAWLIAILVITALVLACATVKASANLAADLARASVEAGAY